jgi:hypothetical protein
MDGLVSDRTANVRLADRGVKGKDLAARNSGTVDVYIRSYILPVPAKPVRWLGSSRDWRARRLSGGEGQWR